MSYSMKGARRIEIDRGEVRRIGVTFRRRLLLEQPLNIHPGDSEDNRIAGARVT